MANTNDQDVELDDNEDVVEAHDPKNAEKQSIGSMKSSENAGPTAKSRKGDKRNSEAAPKTKAGMISVAHDLMSEMSAEKLSNMLNILMGEEAEATSVAEARKVDINVDFTSDLNALVESEATLSEEFKAKTAVIFEAAIKSKLSEEIDRLEEAYATELEEEIASTKADLVEKVDSYLNYVVESWMEENKLAIHTGLRTEIAETFMSKLKDLFIESYVEVPESKVDLFDELTAANEELEEATNTAVVRAMRLAEELEAYKRDAIIRAAAKGLAETQVVKLSALVEDIDFEDEATFAQKVKTIKESYFSKKTAESNLVDETDDETSEEVSGVMAQYVNAIRKSTN
jgi:hypothetical protein